MYSFKQLNWLTLSVLAALLLPGCSSKNNITNHFEIYSGQTSDDKELLYIDNNNNMFVVISRNVFAYQKCGSKLFIKQHPAEGSNGTVNLNTTNYFIIDLNKSYADDRFKPYDTSVENFNNELAKSCHDSSFINL